MPHFKLLNNNYLTPMINYTVVEGLHKNPNEIKTINDQTKKEHGPFKKREEFLDDVRKTALNV